MKKLLSLSLLVGCVYAQNLEMPPMMPTLSASSPKASGSACEAIPPMLHILPPPLQASLDACQIEKFMPKKEAVEAYLKKEKIAYKNLTITSAKEFVRVYEINLGNGKSLFCNETMSRCLK